MCHAFQLGGCESCMHQHTTAQCEPGDCLLLCCSHHCTQHHVCTACWCFSRHMLFCASYDVRTRHYSVRLALILEEHRFQCALQYCQVSYCSLAEDRCVVRCLYLDSICCDVALWPNWRRRQLHRGWSMMWIRTWCTMPSLHWLSEAVFAAWFATKLRQNNRKVKKEAIVLLHMAQNDLHKLVRQIYMRMLLVDLPQHHHSHVHNVLCRQGPQCMCGWSPGLGCRYCGVTSVTGEL